MVGGLVKDREGWGRMSAASSHSCFWCIILFSVADGSDNIPIHRSIVEGRFLVCLRFMISSHLEDFNKRSRTLAFFCGIQSMVEMLVVVAVYIVVNHDVLKFITISRAFSISSGPFFFFII